MPDASFTVFITPKDRTCATCKRPILTGALYCARAGQTDVSCTGCEGLGDHLLLPSGDVALTRRATKHSAVAHPVFWGVKRRNRFERRGTLVEARALQLAEAECEADEAERAVKRAKDAVRREIQDQAYTAHFAARIRELYPSIPEGKDEVIALHACQKHSGRVGRRATAREEADDESICLAVRAYIRHTETPYDNLLAKKHAKEDARAAVLSTVNRVEARWQKRPRS